MRNRTARVDFVSLAGIPLGIGLVLLGQALEGGGIRTLLQGAAAVIVLGGTLGAVLVSFSSREILDAARAAVRAFADTHEAEPAVIGRILAYATRARRSGVMSLESQLDSEPDPFLRRGLTMAVDGSNPGAIRAALEIEADALSEREEQPARIFEAAGGYAPTVGILGAVLGLIHVMENLSDPSKLGPGIAVAFVATIYGVGSANLILLPLASRLRQRADAQARRRAVLVEGVLAVQEGVNPRLIEQRLASFNPPPQSAPAPVERKAPAINARAH